MPPAPAFAATPNLGLAAPSASAMGGTLIAPTNTTTLFTAGGSGSRIEIIRVMQTASTTAAGILNFFVVRSAVFSLVDQFTYGIVALTTTSEANPVDLYYSAFE